jgi:hypothetical protein
MGEGGCRITAAAPLTHVQPRVAIAPGLVTAHALSSVTGEAGSPDGPCEIRPVEATPAMPREAPGRERQATAQPQAARSTSALLPGRPPRPTAPPRRPPAAERRSAFSERINHPNG